MSCRKKELIPRRQQNQRGIPEKECPGIFIPKGDPSWRQKEIIPKCQRENFASAGKFYVVYGFYVDPNLAPAGKFLCSVQFLRGSELAQKELILRWQRDIFAPTEFEIRGIPEKESPGIFIPKGDPI